MEENKLYEVKATEYVLSKYIYPVVFIVIPFILFAVVNLILLKTSRFESDYYLAIISLFIFVLFYNLFKRSFFVIEKLLITNQGVFWEEKSIPWEQVTRIKQWFVLRVDIYFENGNSESVVSFPLRYNLKDFMSFPANAEIVKKLKGKVRFEK